MLVEFSVENFRSIKNEACLSLVASPDDKGSQSHLVTPETKKKTNSPTQLLCSAAIYGANAAGKTNLLRALSTMRTIVVDSKRDLDSIPVTPFLFDSTSRDKPSTFEVICLVNGVRYQYGFSATAEQVTDEWLYAAPRGRIQLWYQRSKDHWKLGNNLSGNREVWRRATRSDALFLTTAISLNNEQLRPLYDWFKKTLCVTTAGIWGRGFTISKVRNNEKSELITFLQAADLGINDLRLSEQEFKPDMVPANVPENIREQIIQDNIGRKIRGIWVGHDVGETKTTELELSEESGGTKKIFALAGQWLDTLRNGHVLVVDELHENLHPNLVRFLVKQFHDPKVNTNGAQLIFSTYDTSILSQEVFRRDQIWFCERNRGQETRLFPLTDFHARKGIDNLERGYLSGRYGAVPYIDSNSIAEE